MKKALLSLLLSAVLFAVPSIQSKAAEQVMTDTVVLEVSEDDVLVQASLYEKPGKVNEAALTISPKAITIGDYTYIFAEQKIDKEFEGYTYGYVYYNDGSEDTYNSYWSSSTRGMYKDFCFRLPKFEGTRDVTVGVRDDEEN